MGTTINNKCGSIEAPTIMNNSENGQVSSSDFPSPYPNDAECVWHIEVSDGMILKITFIELEIEDGYDFLYINDGDSIFAELLLKVSGNIVPNPIESTSSESIILFRSDSSVTEKGFKI